MPLRNRVTPRSELVAHAARGLVYGNRGCLHDDQGRIRRRYNGRRWISCRLEFRGWHRGPLMQPGKFTELFFLDEATAFAAGHRPCALCRREDYVRFGGLWRVLHRGQSGAEAIDEVLHRERVGDDRAQRVHEIESEDLSEGVFVLHEGEPWLLLRSAMRRWTAAGYADRRRRPKGRMLAITPPSLIEVLRTGWNGAVPLLHPSARRD